MKKFIAIIVLGLLLSGNANTEENIIHISCNSIKSYMYDVDRNETSVKNPSGEVIRVFDLDKELLLDTNFRNNKPRPVLIDDKFIKWHNRYKPNDNQKEHFKQMYNEDVYMTIHVLKINRFSGKMTHDFYALNKSHSRTYSENLEKENLNSRIDLINADTVMELAILYSKDQKPQKEFIHVMSTEDECEKVAKQKKF